MLEVLLLLTFCIFTLSSAPLDPSFYKRSLGWIVLDLAGILQRPNFVECFQDFLSAKLFDGHEERLERYWAYDAIYFDVEAKFL